MSSKRQNMFYQNKKQETTEIGELEYQPPEELNPFLQGENEYYKAFSKYNKRETKTHFRKEFMQEKYWSRLFLGWKTKHFFFLRTVFVTYAKSSGLMGINEFLASITILYEYRTFDYIEYTYYIWEVENLNELHFRAFMNVLYNFIEVTEGPLGILASAIINRTEAINQCSKYPIWDFMLRALL
ncbi:hypothetical protein AAG570_008251 [Ranatra chinensis]|uniref:Uncharacterized protein n=1 Tax=Ranatra chinensis TaxID=642074 RepID=A0ABD0YEE3_9HEMI